MSLTLLLMKYSGIIAYSYLSGKQMSRAVLIPWVAVGIVLFPMLTHPTNEDAPLILHK